MRTAVRSGLARWLLAAGVIASCGKDPGVAGAPHPEAKVEPATPDPSASAGSEETGDEDSSRLQLETEFHRTRFGLGTGLWVLGIVHNPHADRVTDVRMRVRLLDESGAAAGGAEGRLDRPLDPSERAAVAVHVPTPVAHEQLGLDATAIVDPAPAPEPLPLKLTHEPPQRADLGGWYVLGTIENTGPTPIDGARVEIQAFDRGGTLLGLDWVHLEPVAGGATAEFEVGDLRYEEAPNRFLLTIRGPAIE